MFCCLHSATVAKACEMLIGKDEFWMLKKSTEGYSVPGACKLKLIKYKNINFASVLEESGQTDYRGEERSELLCR